LAAANWPASLGRLSPLGPFAPLVVERDELQTPLGDATFQVAAAGR
jgi:hypothetical protein